MDNVTAQIKEILSESVDSDAGETPGEDGGEQIQEQDVRGDGSGAGALGEPESIDAASVEDDTEGAEDTDNDGESDSEADEPVDISYLAETLGVDKSEVYDIEVRIDDDTSVTLGQLKDNFIESGPVVEARRELAQQTDKFQRDVMTTKTHINMMMAAAVTPQEQALLDRMLKAAAGNTEQWNSEQDRILKDTLPAWDDVATRQQDMADIAALGSEYGFSKPEIEATKDARTLRLLRDAARDRKRLAEMQDPAKRKHVSANAPAKKAGKGLTRRRLQEAHNRAKGSKHISGKTDYVRQLITEG